VSNRLGFVSVAGVLVAGVVLAVVLAWTLIAGPVLFSPGPLSSKPRAQALGGVISHAQLAGNCGACHAAPWSSQTMVGLCLACHADIAGQVQSHGGLHGQLLGALSSPTCRGCHTEHHGPTGALTVINETTFPHDLTHYSLQGHRRSARGAKITCTDCHPKSLARFDQATCADCHVALNASFMTRHEAAFGKTCLLCHDGTGRDGANFDHNAFPFKLTGKHAGVACERCHTGSGVTRSPQNTPQDCFSCHARNDKHNGTFGQQCGGCHTPDGWNNAKFDHNIFPVSHGSRERVATCQTCHPTDLHTYTCFGCHAHTPANVQARHEGRALANLTDCIRCHAGGRKEGGGD
jgi:hypothetical protein